MDRWIVQQQDNDRRKTLAQTIRRGEQTKSDSCLDAAYIKNLKQTKTEVHPLMNPEFTPDERQRIYDLFISMTIAKFEWIVMSGIYVSPCAALIRDGLFAHKKSLINYSLMPRGRLVGNGMTRLNMVRLHTGYMSNNLTHTYVNTIAGTGEGVWKPRRSWEFDKAPFEKLIHAQMLEYCKTPDGRLIRGREKLGLKTLGWSIEKLEHYRNWHHMLEEFKAYSPKKGGRSRPWYMRDRSSWMMIDRQVMGTDYCPTPSHRTVMTWYMKGHQQLHAAPAAAAATALLDHEFDRAATATAL